MCYTIQSENLLANYFATNKKTKVTFVQLDDIRAKIEESFKENVYVDITFDSLVAAVNFNDEIFDLEESQINLKKAGRELIKTSGFVELNYNWCLPMEIKDKYLNLLEKMFHGKK